MSRLLKVILIVISLVVGFGLVYRHVGFVQYEYEHAFAGATDIFSTTQEVLAQTVASIEPPRTYKVLLGGDVMLDRGVESKVLAEDIGGGDWTFPWKLIADDIRDYDLSFVNLEGSISDVGADTGKKFSFRFKPESAAGLQYAGIDVVALANNHMLDWGRSSLCESPANLAKYSVASVGAGCNREEANRPYITNLGDTRVAFIAYTTFYKDAYATDSRTGITKFDEDEILATIRDLKENQDVDLVFLSMHWGTEYKTRSNAGQQSLAHRLLDGGLDVLVGHHPHVVQEIERYGDGWIIYSLGNFIFDQHFSEETMEGLLTEVHIQKGSILDIKPIHIEINKNYQPYIE